MSATRKSPIPGSATMLTLSLAICFAAAAEAAAGPPAVRAVDSSERVTLNPRQRHALATLFAQLTDAARKFQQAPQVAIAPASPRGADLEPQQPQAMRRPLDHPCSPPAPPLRAALHNLPPPAMC